MTFKEDELASLARTLKGVHSLENYTIVEVRGEDGADFLNAQLSSDIRNQTTGTAQFSSWCDNKGRVIVTLHTIKLQTDRLYLLLREAVTGTFIDAIRRYVFRLKVKISVPNVLVYAVIGTDQMAEISDLSGNADSPNDADNSWHRVSVISSGCGKDIPTFTTDSISLIVLNNDLASSDSDAGQLHQHLVSVQATTRFGWDLYQMLAGKAIVDNDHQNRYVAQMLNLDAIDAIDFDKGCFPGQEIIARAKYLGQVKKHMHLARSSVQPQCGAIYVCGVDGNKALHIGEMIHSLALADDLFLLQIVIRDRFRNNKLYLDEFGQNEIQLVL